MALAALIVAILVGVVELHTRWRVTAELTKLAHHIVALRDRAARLESRARSTDRGYL